MNRSVAGQGDEKTILKSQTVYGGSGLALFHLDGKQVFGYQVFGANTKGADTRKFAISISSFMVDAQEEY